MFSTSLFFTTTLFASLAVSVVHAGVLTVDKPTGLVQCSNSTLSWNGGTGPYNVYVFTDCKDPNEDPVSQFLGVVGNSVTWYVNQVSGSGIFVEVDDATGDSADSDDAYIGGDASQAGACSKKVAALASSTVSSTASTTTTVMPTTMTNSHTTITGNGVANAVKATSSTPSATATGLTNGASALVARPMEIGVGLAALGLAAML